jgi:plasmid stability protein
MQALYDIACANTRDVAILCEWEQQRSEYMGEVRVRNVSDDVVEQWKARARLHGHSLQEELRSLLEDEAYRPRREMAAKLRELRESIRSECGELPDSTPGIREERDRRG